MLTSRKSYSILVTMLTVMIGCDNKDILPKQQSSSIENQNALSPPPYACSGSGSPAFAKVGDYNCHEYVRGALVLGLVDLTTGQPQNVDLSNSNTGTIQTDPNFIRVCSVNDAKAIAHLPIGADHSALIVQTHYAYSFPGGTHVYTSGVATHYGTACDYEYYAAIPDVTISGPVKINATDYKFTLLNKSKYPFIIADANRWWVDPALFTVKSKTDTEITVAPTASCPNGTYTIKAKINSSATKSPSDCPLGIGVNNLPATSYVPEKTKTFTLTNCDGTLDGSSTLLTVNSITYGSHQVVMNVCSMTWVKTSGNASYTVLNGGKQMNFTLTSGSVTFHAYGGGCDRNITFYGH